MPDELCSRWPVHAPLAGSARGAVTDPKRLDAWGLPQPDAPKGAYTSEAWQRAADESRPCERCDGPTAFPMGGLDYGEIKSEFICMDCWRAATGVPEDPATKAMLERIKRIQWPACSPEDREAVRQLIADNGWPATCPRCDAFVVLEGWDVKSDQCMKCWLRDLDEAAANEAELRENLSGRVHPSTGWCRAVKTTGERCTFDVVQDGLCRVHWRQAQDRHDRGKGFAPDERSDTGW